MYLINASYFIREYVVPNVAQQDKADALNIGYYVDEKVRLFLRYVLNETLFTSLDSDIDANGDLKTTAAQRWKDLVNGKTYTKDEKQYKWLGLLQTQGSYKSSLLTPMVYYFWLAEEYSKMSGSGEAVIVPKNARVVNSTQRIVRACHDFLNQYQGNCRTTTRAYMHNGVLVYDYYGGDNLTPVSMRQFLLDNKSDFPDAMIPELSLDINNQLGI